MDLNALFVRAVVYPLMSAVKGNRIMRYLTELKASERLSTASIHDLQMNKLRLLLEHSIETVPAYHRYQDLLPIEGDPSTIMKTLHICTKTEVRTNGASYISTTADRSKLIPNKTGGSTGQPTQFYMDRVNVEYYEAARWRGLSWWGIKPGDKVIAILGNPSEYSNKKLLQERLLKNRVILPGYDLRRDDTRTYVSTIEKEKPVYLYGYASAIYLLAKYIEELNLPIHVNLKCIVTTAETIHPYQRATIEKVFRTRVVNEYGAKDGGIIAYECQHGGLHLTSENLHLEVVDPITKEPLPMGDTGELLVTDLNNFSMPRLRYEIGDMGALNDEPCSCGNPLPVLKGLEGRKDDMLLKDSGDAVPGHYFAHIAGNIEGFERYQIVQQSMKQFQLKIVKNSSFRHDEVEYIVSAIKDKMGDVHVDVIYTDDIPPTASGKQRLVIREDF